jgi:Holliday junction resolvasome RuvABC endonuclease subunit
MRVMGLDLSLTSTGVSIDGQTSVIAVKTRGAERLYDISSMVLERCNTMGVQIVGVEGYSFASRNSQAHSIGELGGAVRMRLWERNIPYIEIPPTCRAKFATGRGNASKGEVISAISAKTGLVFSGAGGNDECDAWVLEEMVLARLGSSKFSWTADRLSALDKVDWAALKGVM